MITLKHWEHLYVLHPQTNHAHPLPSHTGGSTIIFDWPWCPRHHGDINSCNPEHPSAILARLNSNDRRN